MDEEHIVEMYLTPEGPELYHIHYKGLQITNLYPDRQEFDSPPDIWEWAKQMVAEDLAKRASYLLRQA